MAFNFPDAPSAGTVFTDAASGAQYVYTGGVWMQSSAAQIKLSALPRNRIVNPAFQISQENGVSPGTTNGYYTADQWFQSFSTLTATVRVTTVVSAAVSMRSRAQLFATTAQASLSAGSYYNLQQSIEGNRIADFRWNSTNANYRKPAVLRFTVRSGLAGTFAVAVRSFAGDASFVIPVVIAAGEVGAFVEKTVAIPAPAIGTWADDEAGALTIAFVMAAGTTYLTGTTNAWVAGNFFGLTGMTNGLGTISNYLEVANVGLYFDPDATGVAPTWEEPDEAEELAACQRYYFKTYDQATKPGTAAYSGSIRALAQGASNYLGNYSLLPATMRGTPSGIVYNPATGTSGQVAVDAANLAGSIVVYPNAVHVFCNNAGTAANASFSAQAILNARM